MLECLIRLYHVLLKGFSPPISVFPCPLAWHFGHCYYRSYNLSWEDQLVFARTRLTMDSHASNLSKGNSPGSESARAGVGLNEAEQQGSLGPQLRLTARGSSPVEDHARYLGRRQPARSRNSIELNLSGAAKKRSGLPPKSRHFCSYRHSSLRPHRLPQFPHEWTQSLSIRVLWAVLLLFCYHPLPALQQTT